MKYWKKFLRMISDKRYTCRLIAWGCVPLTFYNAALLSPSPEWSAAMVGLNGLMLLIAMTEDE